MKRYLCLLCFSLSLFSCNFNKQPNVQELAAKPIKQYLDTMLIRELQQLDTLYVVRVDTITEMKKQLMREDMYKKDRVISDSLYNLLHDKEQQANMALLLLKAMGDEKYNQFKLMVDSFSQKVQLKKNKKDHDADMLSQIALAKIKADSVHLLDYYIKCYYMTHNSNNIKKDTIEYFILSKDYKVLGRGNYSE